MEQIRQGLKANIDVSLYANPEFSSQEMKKIREKLFEENNISIDPSLL